MKKRDFFHSAPHLLEEPFTTLCLFKFTFLQLKKVYHCVFLRLRQFFSASAKLTLFNTQLD